MGDRDNGAGLTLSEVAPRIFAMWHAVDHRRTQEAIPYCASDFVMQIAGTELDLTRFKEFMEARNQADYNTRHILQNMHITHQDDDTVTVSFVSTVWRLEPGQDVPTNMVGDVIEEWSLVDGEPKIRRRNLSLFCQTRPVDQRPTG